MSRFTPRFSTAVTYKLHDSRTPHTIQLEDALHNGDAPYVLLCWRLKSIGGEKVGVCQGNLLAARTMQKLDDGSYIVEFVFSSSVATTLIFES